MSSKCPKECCKPDYNTIYRKEKKSAEFYSCYRMDTLVRNCCDFRDLFSTSFGEFLCLVHFLSLDVSLTVRARGSHAYSIRKIILIYLGFIQFFLFGKYLWESERHA